MALAHTAAVLSYNIHSPDLRTFSFTANFTLRIDDKTFFSPFITYRILSIQSVTKIKRYKFYYNVPRVICVWNKKS